MKETLGKYISMYYTNKKIPHNNWMLRVAGIDRVNQIKLGLVKIFSVVN